MNKHPTIDDIREEIGEFLERLQQQRDELRVQSHLFKAEMQEEWEHVERKWRQFEQRAGQISNDARESASEIGQALRLVGEEIEAAYRRLRKRD